MDDAIIRQQEEEGLFDLLIGPSHPQQCTDCCTAATNDSKAIIAYSPPTNPPGMVLLYHFRFLLL